MASPAPLSERGMAVGLRALNRLASSDLVDRLGLRDQTERLLHGTAKTTMRTAARAGRTFTAAQQLSRPARQRPARYTDLFDLNPTDEQQMLRDAVHDFSLARLRPAAQVADDGCATAPELLAQANELGLSTVGVPETLGGARERRSAVTSVLVGEALAQGDMGIAVACLAPAAVATGLGLWGDAEQQATYLPVFVGDDVPAAALAVLEPRALFDPFRLQARAAPGNGGYVLDGIKSLVPRASDAELFVVAAELDGRGPGLFIVEAGTAGVAIEPAPAMGLRAAGTGTLTLDNVKLDSGRSSAAGIRPCTRIASRSPGWAGAQSPSEPGRPCSTTWSPT
jgi:alkylation response protein AidB-like acyl-CoA dehydrogenase